MPMRMDVTRAEFDRLGFDQWTMCDGPGPDGSYAHDYAGQPRAFSKVYVRIIQKNSESRCGVTYAMMKAIAGLFETDNINLKASYEGDLSDVTPGNGFEAELWVSPAKGA